MIAKDEDVYIFLEDIKKGYIEILKIERPKYEVIEEKKELLTEEEREFLRLYIKYLNMQGKDVLIGIRKMGSEIWFLISECSGYIYKHNSQAFKGLELNRKYTLKELGLE